MKRYACAILLLGAMLCALPLAAQADDSPPTGTTSTPVSSSSDPISEFLKGQSIELGLSYEQGTFKMRKPGSSSQLTDNGRTAFLLNYTTGEHVLTKYPMKYGDAALAWSVVGSFGQQDTHFQLNPNSSAIIGDDLGSRVKGDFISAAPFLYVRLGPVYPGTDSFWLFGYGAGIAMYHFGGNPIVYTPEANGSILATQVPISQSSTPYFYQTWRWQFHYGSWDVLFTGKQLSGHKVAGYTTSYEDYGLGLAYTLRF
jgi:hypothetical protein